MDTGACRAAARHTLCQYFDLEQAGIPLWEPKQRADAWVLHATQPKLPSYPSDPNNDEFVEETGARTTESHQTKGEKNPKTPSDPETFLRHNQPSALLLQNHTGGSKATLCCHLSESPSIVFIRRSGTELQPKPHQNLTERGPCVGIRGSPTA